MTHPNDTIGIFTTDVNLTVRSWDDWTARVTGTEGTEDDLSLAARREERCVELSERLGVACHLDPVAAATGKRVVVVVVKPKDVETMDAALGLYEALSTCRAIRRLRPDPIPEETLVRVLRAATLA